MREESGIKNKTAQLWANKGVCHESLSNIPKLKVCDRDYWLKNLMIFLKFKAKEQFLFAKLWQITFEAKAQMLPGLDLQKFPLRPVLVLGII